MSQKLQVCPAVKVRLKVKRRKKQAGVKVLQASLHWLIKLCETPWSCDQLIHSWNLSSWTQEVCVCFWWDCILRIISQFFYATCLDLASSFHGNQICCWRSICESSWAEAGLQPTSCFRDLHHIRPVLGLKNIYWWCHLRENTLQDQKCVDIHQCVAVTSSVRSGSGLSLHSDTRIEHWRWVQCGCRDQSSSLTPNWEKKVSVGWVSWLSCTNRPS